MCKTILIVFKSYLFLCIIFRHHKSTHAPQTFVCDHCGCCFKNQDLFIKHSQIHRDVQFKCSHCHKTFKQKKSLKSHLNYSHKLGPIITKFKCDMCEQYFRNNRNLRNHIIKKICLPV